MTHKEILEKIVKADSGLKQFIEMNFSQHLIDPNDYLDLAEMKDSVLILTKQGLIHFYYKNDSYSLDTIHFGDEIIFEFSDMFREKGKYLQFVVPDVTPSLYIELFEKDYLSYEKIILLYNEQLALFNEDKIKKEHNQTVYLEATNELTKLKELLSLGVFTEDEYQEKVGNIKNNLQLGGII